MTIWPLSDTHGHLPDPTGIPKGAFIPFAGDLCPNFGTRLSSEIALQREWLENVFKPWLHALPDGAEFIMTPGNRDFVFEVGEHHQVGLPAEKFHCLIDRGTFIKGIGWVHGTPWSYCPAGWAYVMETEEQFRDKLHYTLPTRPIDLWLVHNPPLGPAGYNVNGVQCGSEQIHRFAEKAKVRTLVTGHVHESYGCYHAVSGRPYLTINASICDENTKPVRGWADVEIGDETHGD